MVRMPDLDNLPGGASIFVDTNIFHFHFEGKSLSCTNFINRISYGEIEAYVNVQVLSDLLHKLMLAEAVAKGCTLKKDAQALKWYLKKQREAKQTLVLTDYQVLFEYITSIGLHVLPMNEKLLVDTKAERVQYYLMTGDSLHLGTMNRRKIGRKLMPLQHIATNDGDFAYIPGITAWQPQDIPRP